MKAKAVFLSGLGDDGRGGHARFLHEREATRLHRLEHAQLLTLLDEDLAPVRGLIGCAHLVEFVLHLRSGQPRGWL